MPRGLTPARVRKLETDLSASISEADRALAGVKLHFCYDLDGLLIDETDPEILGCCCDFG